MYSLIELITNKTNKNNILIMLLSAVVVHLCSPQIHKVVICVPVAFLSGQPFWPSFNGLSIQKEEEPLIIGRYFLNAPFWTRQSCLRQNHPFLHSDAFYKFTQKLLVCICLIAWVGWLDNYLNELVLLIKLSIRECENYTQ